LYCREHNRENTARETERLLRAGFVPSWGERDIQSITRNDVNVVLDGYLAEGSPSAAIHALAAVRKFFNWCVERGLLEASPCERIGRPAPIRSRERTLDDLELAAVWAGAEQVGYPYEQLVQLLLLTAQRRGEVAGMLWSELDLEKAVWLLPASRTKNKRPHYVPLSGGALRIISSLSRAHPAYVFPARGNDEATLSGFSKFKRRLDTLAGLSEAWTLHDLRRSAATGMAGLGVPPHIVERILNHVSGSFGGVAGIYNRFAYEAEMRQALEMWGGHLEKISAQRRAGDMD
jgi:integrase